MPDLPLLARAASHGTNTALRCGDATSSYADLLRGAHTLAAALLDGAADLAEARVAALVPADASYVHTQWGTWLAGGVAVPLSLAATPKELAYAVADSQASTVVTTSERRAALEPIVAAHGSRLLVLDEIHDAVPAALPDLTPARRGLMLYTSGTTSSRSDIARSTATACP